MPVSSASIATVKQVPNGIANSARQLNPLSLYLGIRRQRGSVPSEKFPTFSGGSVRVGADGRMTIGKPEAVETPEEDATRLHVSAPNVREMRQAD